MNKPFKTYNQQLKILRSRNLEISNGSKAISILKRENYYSIINGYKEIFLDNNSKEVEQFKIGTTFEHIYALFEFDRNLRGIFLKYILKFESSIKTKISYHFSEVYRAPFSYLNVNNFKENNLNSVTTLIARISAEISRNTKNQKGQIAHYLNKYNNLPLWVLMKKLDFGATSYFYDALKNELKLAICEEILKEYKREYKLDVSIDNDYLQLKNILAFVNVYRNTCAHDERLYNLKVTGDKIKFRHFYFPSLINNYRLYDLVIILKVFLTKKDFKKMILLLRDEIADLHKALPENLYRLVLIRMGFPKNWQDIF